MTKLLLKEQSLFYTPKDAEYLKNWVEKHNASEKVHLYTALGMLQNLIVAANKNSDLVFEDDETGMSNCCGAPSLPETDICAACLEHADFTGEEV